MKTIQFVLMSLTGILLFNTIVCGIWMRYSGALITDANKNYHMVSAILTVVFVVVTMVIMARR
jgi:hypothetical protein